MSVVIVILLQSLLATLSSCDIFFVFLTLVEDELMKGNVPAKFSTGRSN